ncbi:MAG TPA: hydroxyacid dehydrogenase, partial [Casimicrobiaceae bacterium]|nr:hydroxyacid dehydrogenase [Casimicrobiaceae bacterium]
MARIFVTFSPQMRKNYYGERALAGLQALGEVELNPAARALSTHELIEAACGCEFIVSDRQTPGEGELFRRLP